MKLTPRGRAAVALVVLSVVLGWQFGARSLNAVGMPVAAALLVGAIVVARADAPTLEHSTLAPGFPGETRTLSVTLTGGGLTTVSLPLPSGIEGDDSEQTVSLPETVEFDIDLADRGLYHLGPPRVSQRGPLGLVERRVEPRGTTELAVYPELESVSRETVLSQFFADELEAERQEFERLREYTPSDPLRRVHWKSSAKHDEFLVMEFVPSERSRTVTIAGSAPKRAADEMARLVATIADIALDAGFNVEVAVAEGHIPPGQGTAHRENILWLLARTEGGPSELDGETADIEVRGGRQGTTVRIADTEYDAAELRSRRETEPDAAGSSEQEVAA